MLLVSHIAIYLKAYPFLCEQEGVRLLLLLEGEEWLGYCCIVFRNCKKLVPPTCPYHLFLSRISCRSQEQRRAFAIIPTNATSSRSLAYAVPTLFSAKLTSCFAIKLFKVCELVFLRFQKSEAANNNGSITLNEYALTDVSERTPLRSMAHTDSDHRCSERNDHYRSTNSHETRFAFSIVFMLLRSLLMLMASTKSL